MTRRLLFFIGFIPLLVQGQIRHTPAPILPNFLIKQRVEQLDRHTPIHLEYNDKVKNYIDAYTMRRREHLSTILARAELYFPLFEEYLAKYNLPQELKYLAVVESALDPRAKSPSGAMGLWQFLYQAGRMFGLEVTSYQDQRCDPAQSTDAACQYLQYLYENLNDWQLALAAYNGGIAVVNNAIQRSGGKRNFWQLLPYLPEPVQGYVPAFIAANYAMVYHADHQIQAAKPLIAFDQIDTVYLHRTHTFEQLAKAAGTSLEMISFLNPSYTRQVIPVYEKPVPLYLPKKHIKQFIEAEKKLEPQTEATPQALRYRSRTPIENHYTVQKGEFFHQIAIRHRTSVENLMEWNQLKSRNLYAGQWLKIYEFIPAEPYFFVVAEMQR